MPKVIYKNTKENAEYYARVLKPIISFRKTIGNPLIPNWHDFIKPPTRDLLTPKYNNQAIVKLDIKNFFESIPLSEIKEAAIELSAVFGIDRKEFLENVTVKSKNTRILPVGYSTSSFVSEYIISKYIPKTINADIYLNDTHSKYFKNCKFNHEATFRMFRYVDDIVFSICFYNGDISHRRELLKRISIQLIFDIFKQASQTFTSKQFPNWITFNSKKIKLISYNGALQDTIRYNTVNQFENNQYEVPLTLSEDFNYSYLPFVSNLKSAGIRIVTSEELDQNNKTITVGKTSVLSSRKAKKYRESFIKVIKHQVSDIKSSISDLLEIENPDYLAAIAKYLLILARKIDIELNLLSPSSVITPELKIHYDRCHVSLNKMKMVSPISQTVALTYLAASDIYNLFIALFNSHNLKTEHITLKDAEDFILGNNKTDPLFKQMGQTISMHMVQRYSASLEPASDYKFTTLNINYGQLPTNFDTNYRWGSIVSSIIKPCVRNHFTTNPTHESTTKYWLRHHGTNANKESKMLLFSKDQISSFDKYSYSGTLIEKNIPETTTQFLSLFAFCILAKTSQYNINNFFYQL